MKKNNKNKILYSIAIALPILTIIVLIVGSIHTSSPFEDIMNNSSQSASSSSSASDSSASSSKSSGSSSKSSSSNSTGSSSKSSSGKSSAAKARKSAEDYDAGYNAIYEDDDYSQSKYNKNRDYAMGVDDAIDDLDWD